jgi:hypothetical protein
MVCLIYLQWVHVHGGLFNDVVAYYLFDSNCEYCIGSMYMVQLSKNLVGYIL